MREMRKKRLETKINSQTRHKKKHRRSRRVGGRNDHLRLRARDCGYSQKKKETKIELHVKKKHVRIYSELSGLEPN